MPPAGVSVIVPSYEPAASPDGLTETANAAGVWAEAGDTLSQLAPTVTAGVTVTALPLDVTFTVWLAGMIPDCALNVSELGAAVIDGTAVDVTVKAIGIVSGLFPAPGIARTTDPVYVPAARLLPFTEMVIVPGVLPATGVTESHCPRFDGDLVAVKDTLRPVVEMLTLCPAGAAPPFTWVNESDVGDTIASVAAVTLKVTETG